MEGVEETIIGTGVAEPIFEGGFETIVFVTFTALIFLENLLSVPSFLPIAPPPVLNIPPLHFLSGISFSEPELSTLPSPPRSALSPRFIDVGLYAIPVVQSLISSSLSPHPIVLFLNSFPALAACCIAVFPLFWFTLLIVDISFLSLLS